MNPADSPNPGLVHLAGGKPADAGQLVLHRRLRLVRPLLPPNRGHLVDFGCGNGAQTLLLAPEFERVTGLDISEDYLADFRTEIERRGLGAQVDGLATSGGAIPLPDASADCVTSFTVLEHVPDERAVLAEMRRILRPEGRLILSVPNRWWVFETHGANLPLLPWNRVPFVSWWPKPLHDRWARARIYRMREICRLLEETGFSVSARFRMTAPMDMIPWEPLRRLVRGTVFRTDRTAFPVLATEIMVVATR